MSDKKGVELPTLHVSLKINEVKAISLFAAQDECRLACCGVNVELKESKVLLVATDGKRLAALKAWHENKGGIGDLLLPNDFLKHVFHAIGRFKHPYDSVTFRREQGKLQAFIETEDFSATVLYKRNLDWINYTFPKWRQAVPNPFKKPDLNSGRNHCFNSRYMAEYHKAAALLGDGSGPSVENSTVNTSSMDEMQPIFIRLPRHPEFASVLMPVRQEGFTPNETLDWMDIDWKAGEAPKVETPKAEEAKAPAP